MIGYTIERATLQQHTAPATYLPWWADSRDFTGKIYAFFFFEKRLR